MTFQELLGVLLNGVEQKVALDERHQAQRAPSNRAKPFGATGQERPQSTLLNSIVTELLKRVLKTIDDKSRPPAPCEASEFRFGSFRRSTSETRGPGETGRPDATPTNLTQVRTQRFRDKIT
ncbi:hypothetical protein ACFVSN_37610 [Kitasatospora sp. NPDC057904]|uniref:hypothetical protein n=1 Tax=Kitasatospora sp. NPDC057904 TaxID=3346275 RepID=UPI0036D75F89